MAHLCFKAVSVCLAPADFCAAFLFYFILFIFLWCRMTDNGFVVDPKCKLSKLLAAYELIDNSGWESSSQNKSHISLFRCLACNDGIWRERKNCPRHERTEKHAKAVALQHASHELELHRSRLQGTVPCDTQDIYFVPNALGMLARAFNSILFIEHNSFLLPTRTEHGCARLA